MPQIQYTTHWLNSADELVDLARRIESRLIDTPPTHLLADVERRHYRRLRRLVRDARQLLHDLTPEELREAL